MKILFVAPCLHPNQHFVVKILIERKHEVRFFVRFWDAFQQKHAAIKPTVMKHSPVFLFTKKHVFRKKENTGTSFDRKYGFPSIREYFRAIQDAHADVVIARDPNDISSFISLCMARLLNIRKIIMYTQGALHRKQNMKTKISKLLLTFFRAVWITPVEGDKEKFAKFDKRAYYLPFPVEPVVTSFKEKQFFCDNKINVLTVGRLNEERKNHLLLLRVVNELKQDFPLKITMVGSLNRENEYFQSILRFIQENKLQDMVTIKRNLDLLEVYEEYKRHDLFVLPSSNEPFGFSVLEAMACGLPVICSSAAGVRWCLREGENGYVFTDKNGDDLKKKMNRIISRKETIVNMGEQSYNLVKTRHSPEAFYERFMAICEGAYIENRKDGAHGRRKTV